MLKHFDFEEPTYFMEEWSMKGSIRQHEDTWQIALYLGVENGKGRYLRKSGFPTQQAAQQAMQEALHLINKDGFVQPTELTLGEYLNKWLEDMSRVVQFGTLKKYKWIVNHHIIPALGSTPLQSLTQLQVQSFYDSLHNVDNPLSRGSILLVHRVLGNALQAAVKSGYLARNVAAAVNASYASSSKLKVWTREEANAFLNAARGNRYFIAFARILLARRSHYWSSCYLPRHKTPCFSYGNIRRLPEAKYPLLAAKNILAAGLAVLACGEAVRPTWIHPWGEVNVEMQLSVININASIRSAV
jgi:hypothetical protein